MRRLIAAAALAAMTPVVAVAQAGPPIAATPLPAAQAVLALAERAADWQLSQRGNFATIPTAGPETRSSKNWQQAAFYIGLTKLAERSRAPRLAKAVSDNAVGNEWQLAPRPFHADDQAIGATYIWAFEKGAPRTAFASFQQRADAIIAAAPAGSLDFEKDCQKRWCWSDALFMAPPGWFALSRVTGDPRYAAYADREFRASTDFLYDKTEHLYYRDSRFFARRGPNQEKVFWARGNGWAFAGLARIIEQLPAGDPRRPYYVGLFREMAAKLIAIQKPDGYWSPSLLADAKTMPPESSGTGFFVYGLAWGANNGLLDRRVAMPAVRKGYAALVKAVQPDGMLGWVQQVSDRPDVVNPRDTQYYGVGAFLLASSAVYDLRRKGVR